MACLIIRNIVINKTRVSLAVVFDLLSFTFQVSLINQRSIKQNPSSFLGGEGGNIAIYGLYRYVPL